MYKGTNFNNSRTLVKFLNDYTIAKDDIVSITMCNGVFTLIYKD